MLKPKFYITDVFGSEKYTGNQLATFVDCGELETSVMQAIAREINFSETTFITSRDETDGGYNVRIFTPNNEIPFAGHPTLGTAFILKKYIMSKPAKQVVLNLGVGQIPVKFPEDETGELWMKQAEPDFGSKISVEDAAELLGISPDGVDSDFPVEEASTGLPHLVVPLKSAAALKSINFDMDVYSRMDHKIHAKSVIAFCRGGYTDKQSLMVRVFPVGYGIPEDPATGSGNGCLAAWLVKNRYFHSDNIDIKTGQGYEIGRPSQLSLKAVKEDGKIHVYVGGYVFSVAEGVWG